MGAGPPQKLNDGLHKLITGAFKRGATNQIAADCAKIHVSTLYNWIVQGDNDKQAEEDTKYSALLDGIKEARSYVDMSCLDNIKRAGDDGAWQADAWMLERRRPAEFGRNATGRIQIKGEGPEEKIQSTYKLMSNGELSVDNGAKLISALQKQVELSQAEEFRKEIAGLYKEIDKLENQGGFDNGPSSKEHAGKQEDQDRQ